jgi:adenylate kinase family enzyme
MQHQIIILHGLSNVGKTTAANWLKTNFNIPTITPITRFKEFLEEVNGLESGALNTQEQKEKLIPESEFTYGDLLIKSFSFYQTHDRYFGAKMLMNELTTYLVTADYFNKKCYCCIESLRNPEEIEAIETLKEEFPIDLNVVNIYSQNAIAHESDVFFTKNKERLRVIADNYFNIENNNSLEAFYDRLLNILESIVLEQTMGSSYQD